MFKNPLLARLAGAGLLALVCLAAQPAQAGVTVYTDRALFNGAVGAGTVDSFDDLTPGSALQGPLQRSGYRASVPDINGYGSANLGDALFPINAGGSTALSPNFAEYAIVFSQFSSALRGIGGDFSATGLDGSFIAGVLTLTVVDGGGSHSFDLPTAAAGAGFWGLVSDTAITRLSVATQPGGSDFSFATVDNLTLSTIAAVPEPTSLALLIAGLAITLALPRRTVSRRGRRP